MLIFRNRQNLILCLIILLTIVIFPQTIFAQTPHNQNILFINQVRGEECCNPGSFKFFQKQVETFEENDIKATFVIRYDALSNTKYQKYIKNISKKYFEIGLFLEITPNLAKDAGVAYIGNTENWYQAQHAYTLGYSQEDRIKILDTAFTQFYTIFGYYPKTTTAWIMDSFSLTYIQEKYGVTTHQITREQWGTDSYTLSGGPPHYPYLASKNWAFIPQQTQKEQNLPLLIVRQTITDPVFNYGDNTNAFTSQPNDYSIDGKNFTYFTKLFNQTMDQEPNTYSFALLGLENSMQQQYQDEFIKQIRYVSENFDPEHTTQKASSFYTKFIENMQKQTVTVYHGKDSNSQNPDTSQAFWITTPYYRVRIRNKKDEMFISDIRIYDETWIDPYNKYTAQNLAYWVAPFIIDGSRFYQKDHQIKGKNVKTVLQNILLPEIRYKEKKFLPSKNDRYTQPTRIQLPFKEPGSNIKLSYTKETNTIHISYANTNKNITSLHFHEQNFQIENTSNRDKIVYKIEHMSNPYIQILQAEKGNFELAWMQKNGQEINKPKLFPQNNIFKNKKNKKNTLLYSMKAHKEKENIWKFTPNISKSFNMEKFQKVFYPYVFPELIPRETDSSKTIIYAHNRYAIVGRNPVRFVVIPKDAYGFQTKTKNLPQVIVQPEVDNITIQEQHGTNGIYFIDIMEKEKSGKYTVTVTIDEKSEKQSVFFTPNCKTQKKYCILHLVEAVRYIKNGFFNWLRMD